MGEAHLRKKIKIKIPYVQIFFSLLHNFFVYTIIRIDTPFPQIEKHVNTGNMYDIQVTNKTCIRNELYLGFKT